MSWTTDQFKPAPYRGNPHGPGFIVWLAVWQNGGHHALIGAPTLDALAHRLHQITGTELSRVLAQRAELFSAQPDA